MILGTEVLDSESIAEIVSAHSKLQVHYRLVGNYSAEAGFKATCELLYENEVVDVIFIGNKCMESGVFQAARMLGYDCLLYTSARAMHPDSAGSQFFIMHKTSPHLDGAYAAFGKVTEGMDVVNKIAETATDYSDRPLEEQKMRCV